MALMLAAGDSKIVLGLFYIAVRPIPLKADH